MKSAGSFRFLQPLALFLLLTAPCAFALPQPQGPINDLAHVLSEADKTKLRSILGEVESKTTVEIFVATVLSLEGMTVEDYANKLFNQWGVGKKGKNNGLLVVVCPPERKVRIEVGYGLEGTIPDGVTGDVIRRAFIPRFKQNDYGGGIVAGVEQLARLAEGEELPAGPTAGERASAVMGFGGQLALAAFFSLFIFLGATAVGYALGSKTGFFIVWGGMFAGVPYTMALAAFGTAPWITLLLLFEGFVCLVWGFRLGKKHPKFGRGTSTTHSGWTFGGSGGGGSSSGGFSSGGGGGGGSSGGGGASGSW